MKNRSNTHTYLLDHINHSVNSLSLRIDLITIDSIYVKLSFDTSYVLIGKLSHSSFRFESSYYFGLLVCTLPQNQASKLILLSFKRIRIKSIYNQLSADTSFVIIDHYIMFIVVYKVNSK